MIKGGNKRGWIRIVEAFIAVLLVTGVLLIFINKGYLGGDKKDISEKVYNVQVAVLREIQLDPTLRSSILTYDSSIEGNTEKIPVGSNEAGFPLDVLDKINTRVAEYEYLDCVASICELDKVCSQPEGTAASAKDVYAQSVAISAEQGVDSFNPRQLKLFCWTK